MRGPLATLFAAALTLFGCAQAVRAEPVIAAVRVNGEPSGVVTLDINGDKVAADFAALHRLRLKGPQGAAATSDVVLTDIPGVSVRFDQASQAVDIDAPTSALQSTTVQTRRPIVKGPDRPSWGVALNYAVFGMVGAGGTSEVSALAETRVFGPHGVLTNSVTLHQGANADSKAIRRLETSYVLDDYGHSRSLAVGDFISSSLPWTTAVRAGGLRLSTDFSLRPDLIVSPQPQIKGAAAVASAVDLYVDGVKRLNAKVPSGPFAIETTPMVDGQGRVDLVVRDALGRETRQSLPFYAASELLAPRRTDYSFELGALREDYASDTDRYTRGFAAATVRRGLTNSTTVEGRIAGRGDLQTAGAGVVTKLAEQALFAAAFSQSQASGASGSQVFLSARRQTPLYGVYLSLQRSSSGYRDLDWRPDQTRLTQNLQIGGSVRSDRWGAVSANYSRLDSDKGKFGVGSVNWSKGVGPISVYANAFAGHGGGGHGFSFGFNALLGRTRSFSAAATSSEGGARLSAAIVSPSPLPSGWGWRMLGEAGVRGQSGDRLEAEAQRTTAVGEFGVGISGAQRQSAARIYGSGSLVWLGGRPIAAARLGDGFALVDTGAPNVAVTVENRPAGRTDRNGRLLVPQLPTQMASRIALQPQSVALDQDIKIQTLFVRPPRGSGVRLSMPVTRNRALMASFVDAQGRLLPPGGTVTVNGQPSGPVGYDGLAYLTGLATDNVIEILDKAGDCRMEIHLDDNPSTLRPIGPLVCRRDPPFDPFGPAGRVADSGPGGN